MRGLSHRGYVVLAAAAALLTAAASDASAASITYVSGPTTVGGVTVNVSAQFDFDPTNHKITLTLLNLQLNPSSLDQLIAGVKFVVTGAGTSLSTPTMASSGISTFNVDANGIPQTNVQSNTWSVSASGTQVNFCTVCATSYGHELLIGGPRASNGKYDTAFRNTQNPFSIASNATYASGALHNLDTSPSFVFNIASITPSVNVASVDFDFGMTYGDNDLFLTPEPGAAATMLGGVGLILIGCWKRKGRARKTSEER